MRIRKVVESRDHNLEKEILTSVFEVLSDGAQAQVAQDPDLSASNSPKRMGAIGMRWIRQLLEASELVLDKDGAAQALSCSATCFRALDQIVPRCS